MQVTKRPVHARPGMHMQQCLASWGQIWSGPPQHFGHSEGVGKEVVMPGSESGYPPWAGGGGG